MTRFFFFFFFFAVALLLLVSSCQAFAPTTRPSTSTALQMGLFDAFMPKKKPEGEKKGGMDVNVFGGRGARITIREDEDNAMWIDEPKDKKKGGKKGK